MTETGLTGPLVSAWGSLYNIVQQTNKIINGIKGNSSNSEEVKNPYIAEARFMRGVAYSYLAMLWGNVIINEDTDELVANPIVNTSPVSDVYEFAMRDLEFAAKYLPEVSSAAGRVNKYSAFGMLSRVYLTYAGYSSNPNSATRNQDYLDLAKKAALKVIENRNFELMTDYADLFMIDKNNNSETLFALQWVSNGTYGECNTIQDYFACESAITGNDRAWGGYVFAQPDVIWEYEKEINGVSRLGWLMAIIILKYRKQTEDILVRRKHRVLFPEFIVRNMFVVLAKIMRRSLPEVLLSILTCCVWQKYI